MLHFDVNWLAVVLATVASMVLGIFWYMSLSKQWIAASGHTSEDVDPKDVSPYIWSTVVQFVMAYFVALLTPLLMGETNVANGALIGAHMWLGFVMTSMILNHRYQGRPWALTFIDGGYMLGVLVLQGIVIGVFG